MYLGYTILEYLFMITWLTLCVGLAYCYVKINDLKDQVSYHKYINSLKNDCEK